MATRKKPVCAARLVVVKPGKMTVKGRKDIARWLRSRANWLEKHGGACAPAAGNWTARYLYG